VSQFVAECFWPGVDEADLERLDARVRSALAMSEGVRYRGSMLMPEDEVVFCFFDGPSAEAVRAVAERARVPLERVVASTHFVPTLGAETP
jgi:hypothetical protein